MSGISILLVTSDAFTQGTIDQAVRDALGVGLVKRPAFHRGDTLAAETGRSFSLFIVDATDEATGAKDLMKATKWERRTAVSPVVVLAPPGGNRLAYECLQLGANAVLETPVNTDELIGTLWWLLRDRLLSLMGGEKKKKKNEESIPAATPIPAMDNSTPPPGAAPAFPSHDLKTEVSGDSVTPDEPGGRKIAAPATPSLVQTERDENPPASLPGTDSGTGARKRKSTYKSKEERLAAEEGPSTRMRLFGYEIEESIGSGGMATVYKAKQVSLERPVAIKVIARDLAQTPEFSARFIREARVQASLSHPNIVQVYDLGSNGPLLYIVMELVEGDALRDWIDGTDGRKLTPVHWMYVAHVLGETLSYLHARQVIHRDVKPANLLIGTNGDMKLSDFGITYRPEGMDVARLTSGNLALGTPFFMSPEQRVNPAAVSTQADVFGAAVTLHVMMVGGLTCHPLPRAEQYIPSLPPDIDAALRPGLESEVDRRAGDVRAITEPYIEALRRHVKATTGQEIARGDLYTRNPFAP